MALKHVFKPKHGEINILIVPIPIKYTGYDFITDWMLGYEHKEHLIQLNIYNIFDKHYAMQAEKSVYGVESYKKRPHLEVLW